MCFGPDGKTIATGHRDSSIHVWELPPELWSARCRKNSAQANDLIRLWEELAGADARQAYKAIFALAEVSEQAVEFLRERLQPSPSVSQDKLQRLIADLDSDAFATREAASRELSMMDEQVMPALNEALQTRLSVEARRRIESLVKAPRVVRSPQKLRRLRSIQVLERSATLQALEVLETLSQGDTFARETKEAKNSLNRVKMKTKAPSS